MKSKARQKQLEEKRRRKAYAMSHPSGKSKYARKVARRRFRAKGEPIPEVLREE